ncbi:MAG: putative lipid II flippase FtsW [Candidatus Omnitrophica bacterium]|nr:putative lipid II flippase FtsW [Candidatus Omnitrophota bacterium]
MNMRDIRVSFFMTFMILLCLGVVMIYSSSCVYALEVMKNGAFFLTRHLMFLVIGSVVMFAVMTVDYRLIQKHARLILGLAFLLLVLVLVPGIGKISSGARRWFSFGPINFQPSEFAKVALIIYLADFFSRKKGMVRSFKQGFVPVMTVMALMCALIIKQPDMGNTVLVFIITLAMFFVAGGRTSYLVSIFLMALPVIIFLVISAPYRLRRVVAFMNPWEDAQGAGFQLSQSQMALGSGGFWGVGLGKSVQKLFYLPAAHTDFIFSIIGEELGFLGAIAVVALFVLLIWQGIRILKNTSDPFGYFICIGILVMIGIQAAVNIGVSIGALPTKGLPLPFISYGGSALIFNMAVIGLILNVSRTQDVGG